MLDFEAGNSSFEAPKNPEVEEAKKQFISLVMEHSVPGEGLPGILRLGLWSIHDPLQVVNINHLHFTVFDLDHDNPGSCLGYQVQARDENSLKAEHTISPSSSDAEILHAGRMAEAILEAEPTMLDESESIFTTRISVVGDVFLDLPPAV